MKCLLFFFFQWNPFHSYTYMQYPVWSSAYTMRKTEENKKNNNRNITITHHEICIKFSYICIIYICFSPQANIQYDFIKADKHVAEVRCGRILCMSFPLHKIFLIVCTMCVYLMYCFDFSPAQIGGTRSSILVCVFWFWCWVAGNSSSSSNSSTWVLRIDNDYFIHICILKMVCGSTTNNFSSVFFSLLIFFCRFLPVSQHPMLSTECYDVRDMYIHIYAQIHIIYTVWKCEKFFIRLCYAYTIPKAYIHIGIWDTYIVATCIKEHVKKFPMFCVDRTHVTHVNGSLLISKSHDNAINLWKWKQSSDDFHYEGSRFDLDKNERFLKKNEKNNEIMKLCWELCSYENIAGIYEIQFKCNSKTK